MKYRTIVADPPWEYPEGFAQRQGAPHRYARERFGATTDGVPIVTRHLPYRSMSVEELRELPMSNLAERNARLFLWATNRYLPDALQLVGTWGFRYRQLIVWDKTPNFNPISGSVAPNACEFLVVASRGTPGRLQKWNSSIIQARKPRSTHSAKPDVFLDLVEQVSPGPYLELFARRQRLGWNTWGNEALEHVAIEPAGGVVA